MEQQTTLECALTHLLHIISVIITHYTDKRKPKLKDDMQASKAFTVAPPSLRYGS